MFLIWAWKMKLLFRGCFSSECNISMTSAVFFKPRSQILSFVYYPGRWWLFIGADLSLSVQRQSERMRERRWRERKEMEGRFHEKEPVQRCNWYFSFFRKPFSLTEVQQMSQGAASFAETPTRFIIVFLCSFCFFSLFDPPFIKLWC